MTEHRYINALRLKAAPDTGYIATLPAVRFLARAGELPLESDVTFFVGENGTGKSTLLEAVAVAAGFNAEGGTKNFCFSTADTVSPLGNLLTLVRSARERDGFFLRAESFYNVASNIDEMDAGSSFGARVVDSYGGVSLHEQSHGESFLSLVQNRFGGQGLYLLDEPEAALSPARQMTLLLEMKRLVEAQSQFIIATHSPILMAYPGAQILQFSESGVASVAYTDCEHYRLTKYFLNNPEGMLRQLFSQD